MAGTPAQHHGRQVEHIAGLQLPAQACSMLAGIVWHTICTRYNVKDLLKN